MDNVSGKLLFIFILAGLLSCAAAWMVARRYRAAMARLMRAPLAAAPSTPGAVEVTLRPAAEPVSLADNRRAGSRLALLLTGQSLLIAATSAGLWWWVAFPGEPLPLARFAAATLLGAWPVVPALGVLWRWSRWRVLGALVLWCAVAFPILLWRSIDPRPLDLLLVLVNEMGLGFVLVALMTLGNATRPIAPWLFLPVAVLTGSTLAGLDLLTYLAERKSPLLTWIPDWIGDGSGSTSAIATTARGSTY